MTFCPGTFCPEAFYVRQPGEVGFKLKKNSEDYFTPPLRFAEYFFTPPLIFAEYFSDPLKRQKFPRDEIFAGIYHHFLFFMSIMVYHFYMLTLQSLILLWS